jgi:hypothetical protein
VGRPLKGWGVADEKRELSGKEVRGREGSVRAGVATTPEATSDGGCWTCVQLSTPGCPGCVFPVREGSCTDGGKADAPGSASSRLEVARGVVSVADGAGR